MIPSYLMSFTELRNQMIDWLHFLCNNLHFRQETLYRSISIFDIYISKAYTNENLFDIENVKLIAIASLSLSTKIEEINYNITIPRDFENNMDIHRIFLYLNKNTKKLLPKVNDIFAEYFLPYHRPPRLPLGC